LTVVHIIASGTTCRMCWEGVIIQQHPGESDNSLCLEREEKKSTGKKTARDKSQGKGKNLKNIKIEDGLGLKGEPAGN